MDRRGESYSGHAQAVQNALAANGAQAFGRYSTQALQQVRTLNGDRFRGWLLEDEPDMRGITEEQLSTQAAQAHVGDPSRPTYVNFSKGIVNGWNGSRQLTQQDKREYCTSADIASVDFYGFTDPSEGQPGAPGYARAMDAMKAACGDRPRSTLREGAAVRVGPDR